LQCKSIHNDEPKHYDQSQVKRIFIIATGYGLGRLDGNNQTISSHYLRVGCWRNE